MTAPSSPDGAAPPPGVAPPRVIAALMSMAGREVAIRLVSFAGSIMLARLLDPVAFGLYAIASSAVNFCSLFSSLGLGPAFVRQPEEPTARDLAALFTFQLAWIAVLGAALAGAAPRIAALYDAPELAGLVCGLAVAMALNGLRIVPLVIAERNLAFGPVALSEGLGHLVYYLCAVPAAAAGLGTWSFAAGMLGSAVAGTAIIYRQVAWRPALSLAWDPIRRHIRFGLMVQGQSVAVFVRDAMMFALGGLAYGAAATGYLAWANQIALTPLLLSGLVARVSYPAWARLQGDPRALAASVEATLAWTGRLSLPAFAVVAGLAPQIIEHVYGPKWQPALASLYLLCATASLAIGTSILIPALHACGRARAALRAAAGWAALTWLLALGFVAAGMSLKALALAMALGTAAAVALVLVEVRDLGLDLRRALARPLLTGLASVLILVPLGPVVVRGIPSLLALAAMVGGAALLANVWGDRRVVSAAIRTALR